MSAYIKFCLCTIALGICFYLPAEADTPSTAPESTVTGSSASQTQPSEFTEAQILQTWGWIIAHQREADHSEISDAEIPVFLKGVAAGFDGKPCPYYYAKIIPDVEKLAKARRAKYVQSIFDRNRAQADAFFAELDKNPNVVKLPSGLRYQIIKPGNGPCPKPQQTVNVHFLGHLLNGTEITQNGPIDLVLWPSLFNSYLYEGLQKLNKGGVMRLYVSSPPTDTEIQMFGIQPGSTVIYEVELLDIKETPPDVLETTLAPPAPAPDPPPPSGYAEDQIVETWGWSVARRTPVFRFQLGQAQLDLLTKGLMEGIKGEEPPYDFNKIQPAVEKFISDGLKRADEEFKQKQLADMDTFFAQLDKNPNVVKLPSGLRYEIVKPGDGPYPKAGNTVKIQYVGSLLSGKIFDRTEEGDSINVELDDPPGNWPIAGWYEGLQKINKGGRIKLYVPPSLGFGADAYNGAPPYSTLIFDITVLDLTDTPK
jgi:FKBP-type peptidyl-prolyl cis-trans isomerase